MRLKKRKIILFFPDFRKSPEERQQDFETLKLSLGYEYGVIMSHLDIRQPAATIRKLRRLSNDAIDIIIGDGLGCFFADNFYGGYNRICINPMLRYQDIKRTITYSAFKTYVDETSKYIDNDIFEETQRWAIISRHVLEHDEYTPSLYGDNISVLEAETIDISPSIIENSILPIVTKLLYSSWTDGNGVHFIHNGRVIDKVIRSIFNCQESYTIPDEVVCIKSGVFRRCKLRKITLSHSLEVIPDDCFRDCKYLEEVVMDCPKLEVLGQSSFQGCVSLKSMSLAKTSLLAIQNECFKQTGLQELQLPDSTKYFDSSAVPDDCKLVINKTRYSQLLDDYRWRLAAYNS